MDGRNRRAGASEHLSDEVLSAYLDREAGLAPAAYARAEAHLAACPTCRQALHELRATIALLGDLPQLAPRRGFVLTPELAAGDARRGRVTSPRLPWVWPVRWASALVTLLFAITVGLDVGNQPATAPAAPVKAGAESTIAALVTQAPRATLTPAAARSANSGAPAASQATATTAPPLQAFGLTPTVFPTPTAVSAPPPPGATLSRGRDWRMAEIGLGLVALLLAVTGFLVPPLLRRRTASV